MRRDLVRDINREAKAAVGPVWARELEAKASTPLERAGLVPGARVSVGDRRVRASAATSRRPLRGGLVPAANYGGIEWGANKTLRAVEGKSRKGKRYAYRRFIGTQFKPWTRQGHAAMHAAGDIGPAIVSSWLKVIVSKLATDFEVER